MYANCWSAGESNRYRSQHGLLGPIIPRQNLFHFNPLTALPNSALMTDNSISTTELQLDSPAQPKLAWITGHLLLNPIWPHPRCYHQHGMLANSPFNSRTYWIHTSHKTIIND